ncbi:putative bifunctional diguanylate cyclase/phosphodiesterase [Paractinoplanes atraurantiacus]|uniref:Diguanylate cyclase (GGDEF) domain-containing protein n=1 Tax=Paractinoplanes atraurantiacus TaxID=1036182 RepID=A0A285FPF3_9ACTN|nr:diguanylate cyclase (GGDEF) domain-containing protein [Actinoplanes atraurantiacus]
MDAARPRNSTANRRLAELCPAVEPGADERLNGPKRRRALIVTWGLAFVVDGLLWLGGRDGFGELPAAYWLMGALAVVVDARPYVVANRRASSVILPSICFTFAIALAWGFGAALAVQIVAVAVAGVRMRQPVRRTLHLALQHTVALAATSAVAALVSLRIGPRYDWDDALLTVAAATAWIVARYGLAAVVARAVAERTRTRWRQRGVEVLATGALLLLGPVVLATAQVGLAFVPLVLLALHAVHRMVRSAGEFERASRVDALTGLPNRRALHASVLSQGRGKRLALLLLDLDRFRTVNDALGHSVGDRLLVEVARRLAAVVPAHDLVVRLGGDEFAVLATRVDGAPGARRIAHHLAEALNRPFAFDGMPVDVSASIGIALQREPGGDGSTLLRQAETAMYDAKQRGDQVAVYGPDAAHHSPDRLALLADLRHALREDAPDDGITLFYQPQIAIATGEVVGVEALLRWRHPERGLVGPEELIRVAEPTPVMRLLTERVLHDVTAQLAQWREAGRPMRAAVNVSARDLHAGDIADRVEDLLRSYGVPADLLQLEITESALMADPHRVLNTITRLDRMGIAISLDDFGTGYSSLQHLRRLPLAEVKIDRSFVLGMATDRGDAAIVRSVIDLAEALGLRAVAEGVEDERTWRLLAEAGCHAAQGWFHARPMPASDLAVWLSRYRPVRLPRAALPSS